MQDLFKQFGKCILVYIAKETILDPYEKNVETTNIVSTRIRGIVQDLVASQISWKIPGVQASKAVSIYTEKRNRSIIEKSSKIIIDAVEYEGWRVNGRMQIREDGDFLFIYAYSK